MRRCERGEYVVVGARECGRIRARRCARRIRGGGRRGR